MIETGRKAGWICQQGIRRLRPPHRLPIDTEQCRAALREFGSQPFFRQNDPRPAFLDNESDVFRRIGSIERHIHSARLEYRKQRDDRLRRAIEEDSHRDLGAHSTLDQQMGQPIALLVDCPVRPLAARPRQAAVNQRHAIRRLLHSLRKQQWN